MVGAFRPHSSLAPDFRVTICLRTADTLLRRFSKFLVVPYEPSVGYVNPTDKLREQLAAAEAEVAALKERVKQLETGKQQ